MNPCNVFNPYIFSYKFSHHPIINRVNIITMNRKSEEKTRKVPVIISIYNCGAYFDWLLYVIKIHNFSHSIYVFR